MTTSRTKDPRKPETKRWGVTLPITGTIYVEVEAEDAKAAIEAALDAEPDDSELQWETHRHIVRGNVFCGMQNEARAEEIE